MAVTRPFVQSFDDVRRELQKLETRLRVLERGVAGLAADFDDNVFGALIGEDGGELLIEDGSEIELERTTTDDDYVLFEDGTELLLEDGYPVEMEDGSPAKETLRRTAIMAHMGLETLPMMLTQEEYEQYGAD